LTGFDDIVTEFFTSKDVRARKPHKCYECDRTIEVGETYQRCSMKCDGELGSYCTCLTCAEIRHAFYCEYETIGDFWSQMRDYVFPEMTTGCLDKLKTPEAKKELLRRWNEWKFSR
jgi:hypothetical protein